MNHALEAIRYNARYLSAIEPLFSGEGAIACLHEKDSTHKIEGKLDYEYHVMYYRDPSQDTDTHNA